MYVNCYVYNLFVHPVHMNLFSAFMVDFFLGSTNRISKVLHDAEASLRDDVEASLRDQESPGLLVWSIYFSGNLRVLPRCQPLPPPKKIK